MAGIAKKIMPISQSMSETEFLDFDADISIALEYTGSPVNISTIPRAVPVEIDEIPTAKVAISPNFLSNSSFPVAQPVVRVPQLGYGASNVKNYEAPVENTIRDLNDLGLPDDGFDGKGGDLNGVESSGPLGFSDSQDHSNELSESSETPTPTPIDCQEIEGFQDSMNPGNWNSTELSLTPQAFSSEISRDRDDSGEVSGGEEEFEGGYEESIMPERRVPERPVAERPAKRGLCYHCHRGNRFTEKEVCLVCDAKYCKRCILKAMGSMPEGRKCLGCIGYPIDESKRHLLGKCSRMLKGLLLESEVKQIMESELSCPANQLPPEQIFVNGRPLYLEELMLLRSCPNPPRNLKPGHYWYDRVAGFWGKEGQKPCQIITPQLDVGNIKMKRDASNGNTDVLINGREITKAELWMLQSAGVECAGSPNFWVDSEGYYQEEGMKVVKGKIWGRKRTKVLCALLSLPTPESPNPGGQLNGAIDRVISGYLEQIGLCKVLLVGNDQSGTSTVYKQARVLYNVPFSEEERQNIKFSIQTNLYGYLGRLLEWCHQFEEESLLEKRRSRSPDKRGPSTMPHEVQDKGEYTIGPGLKAFSDWLMKGMVSHNLDITQEYASYVEELWKDAAIQATYSRRDELDLTGAAGYFLDKAVEIAKVDYEPSETDILYAEGVTASNGLASMEFSFSQKEKEGFRNIGEQQDPLTRCQLIRVNAKILGENCKWLEMFEDVGIVLFCVSLIEYDEYNIDSNGELVNKMLESKRLFESIVTHPTFDEANFLLLLTKFDLLGEKIEQVPLTHCEWFQDFNALVTKSSRSNGKVSPLAQRAFHYIAVKYKRLFKSLTGRNLYVCPVAGLESETVDWAVSYAKEIIRWEQGKLSLCLNDSSCESIDNERSSYSYLSAEDGN